MDGRYEMINRCMAKLDTLLTANMKWTIETNFLQIKLLLLKVKRRSQIDPPRVTEEEFAQMLKLLEVLEVLQSRAGHSNHFSWQEAWCPDANRWERFKPSISTRRVAS